MARTVPVDTDFFKTARARYKLGDDATSDQAQRERDDLAFYAGDQWPADIRLARQGQQPTDGMPAVPARPTLVINKVREPIRQVQNEIRDSDIGVELTPADDFGDLGEVPDGTEILLREGLTRRAIRDSQGQDAWNWAGDRADIAGRGYCVVLTRYLPGKTNDQEIYIHRIYNQAGVVLDPSHVEPDGSDCDWGFIGTWMPWDRYTAEYPRLADDAANPYAEYSEADFMGLTEAYPQWYKCEGDQRAVRVVDYFYTTRTSKTLITVSDGSVMWEDEVPEGVDVLDTRTVVQKQIKWSKIGGGVQELEKTDWPSPEFPIVEFVGEELQPYDEQRRVEGMVRNTRGAQEGTNYLISKFVETVGLAPISRDTIDPDAIDGFEAWWAVANTRTLPYRPYRTRDDQGNEFRAPMPQHGDPNILPIAQGIGLFDEFIKSTTAVPDPTLGNVDPSLKSGRAIRETVANAKGSTSNFVANRIRSIRRIAVIINSLLYPIYGSRPGRLVRIMTGDGTPEAMRIGGGADPRAAGVGQSPQAAPHGSRSQPAAKVAKLTEDAHFNIAVKITKNFETKRQQENSALADIIASNPQFMAWFGDLYLATGDTPNRKQLAERAKVMLAPPIQQMLAAQQSGHPFDPQAQAKIAQLTEQVQHAEAALKELEQIAHGKQVEAQTKVQIEQGQQAGDTERARIQAELQVRLQELKNAGSIRVAEINLLGKGVLADRSAEDEAMALGLEHAHAADQAQLDRDQQQAQAAQAMAHQTQMGDSARAHDTQMLDRQQAQAQPQAAALAPDPGAGGQV